MAKFYGVLKGRIPGVYDNWEEAKAQINGFGGAEYKGFGRREDAEKFVFGTVAIKKNEQKKETTSFEEEIAIYTDGSYRNNKIGFGVIIVNEDGNLIKDCGRYLGNVEHMSLMNIAGEIYAVIRAIQLIKANGLEQKNISIYHDYEGVSKWISGEWKAKNALTKRYVEYFKTHMKDINYKFVHIYSHTNNAFNDEADRLANLGTTL